MIKTKNEIRNEYKEIRKCVVNKKHKSISICEKILKSGLLNNIKVVALYSALCEEVDLSFLFDFAIKNNIVVCFPKVVSHTRMDFFEVANLNQLKEQCFGIKEPLETCKLVSPLSIDLMIVPLVAYDEENNRLGYGKGYYDRYFTKGGNYKKIGVAFKEQKCLFLKNVVNDNDVKLDSVYTD